MPHFQHHGADLGRLLGEEIVDGAPDHHADQFGFAGIADVLRADVFAVAQHGHAVGQLKDLVEAVADVNDADAALAQQPHNAE